MAKYKYLTIIFVTLLLAGCAAGPRPPRRITPPAVSLPERRPAEGAYYTVKRGDTLWRISKMHGVTVEDLLRANRLPDAERISVGQRLYIPAAGAQPTGRDVSPLENSGGGFIWPVAGTIVSSFGDVKGAMRNKGIDIAAREGTQVVASRAGRISFIDEHMKGLGKTLIIDHGDGFSTVYAYNSDIIVAVGDKVEQNQGIAVVGSTGRADAPVLHFEIRKGHEPQNPFHYLP